jgi:hypothetical protein
MVKVVWAAKITGEWTTWANAAALSAAVNPATPTQAASRSAVRPVRCWGCVPIAVDGSDCPHASGGYGQSEASGVISGPVTSIGGGQPTGPFLAPPEAD